MFLGAVAAGTILGGPIGDRLGRKYVIWGSILGVLPVHAAAAARQSVLDADADVVIGLILASAFSAIVVYAQELVPGRVGLISGVFFGFAFGMGGLGAAVLGQLADVIGIETVYRMCAFLPADRTAGGVSSQSGQTPTYNGSRRMSVQPDLAIKVAPCLLFGR